MSQAPLPLPLPFSVQPYHLFLDHSASLLISLPVPGLSMLRVILRTVARVMLWMQSSHLHSPCSPSKKKKIFWKYEITAQPSISDSFKYGLYLYLQLCFPTDFLKVMCIPYHYLLPELALYFPVCVTLSPVFEIPAPYPTSHHLFVETVTVFTVYLQGQLLHEALLSSPFFAPCILTSLHGSCPVLPCIVVIPLLCYKTPEEERNQHTVLCTWKLFLEYHVYVNFITRGYIFKDRFNLSINFKYIHMK